LHLAEVLEEDAVGDHARLLVHLADDVALGGGHQGALGDAATVGVQSIQEWHEAEEAAGIGILGVVIIRGGEGDGLLLVERVAARDPQQFLLGLGQFGRERREKAGQGGADTRQTHPTLREVGTSD
jgi:hypothetical protein